MTIEIRKIYDEKYDPKKYEFHTEGGSLAQQQFLQDCDINVILDRYKKTGTMLHINGQPPKFGDFTSVSEFQTALNKVMEAQDRFDSLPSDIRNKFANDPAKLIEFLGDKNNKEEAEKLGLLKKPEIVEPTIQEQMEKALEANDKKRSSQK